MESKILELMVKDHRRLEHLLDKVEEHVDDEYEMMRKAFDVFEWELEKHLFIEEKAIFTQYNPDDVQEGYKMLPVITKQHNYILNTLQNWRKDVQNNSRIEGFHEFKKYLINHKKFEESDVYPRLDNYLTDAQKKHIIDRISEII
jgi:hemerythrin superfamily protein